MIGTVIRSTGSWYDILSEDKKKYKGRLQGKFKHKGLKVTNPIAVGDKVEFQPDNLNAESYSITKILPRDNYIIRKSTHNPRESHMIAANVDQAVLIATIVFPKTSLGFIDRFLVSVDAYRIPAILVFNKSDLIDAEAGQYQHELMQLYESLSYHSLKTSIVSDEGIEEFRKLLQDKISLVAGHSGVGKSSLVNKIAPGLDLKTSEVSTFANKGVHTTTFAEMFELAENTYIIDTPGIKELGLFEIGDEVLSHYFPEMRSLLGQCKFHDCRHVNEPKCVVKEKVNNGEIALSRYQSYLSMLGDVDNRR